MFPHSTFSNLSFVVVVLGLHCCAGAFSSCGKRGLLFSCGAWAYHYGGISCCRAWVLQHADSLVVMHGLSCPKACGLFPDDSLNPCPLHCQVDFNHWTTRKFSDLSNTQIRLYELQIETLQCLWNAFAIKAKLALYDLISLELSSLLLYHSAPHSLHSTLLNLSYFLKFTMLVKFRHVTFMLSWYHAHTFITTFIPLYYIHWFVYLASLGHKLLICWRDCALLPCLCTPSF